MSNKTAPLTFANIHSGYLISEVIVAVLAFLGNFLIIVAFVRHRSLHVYANYYIVSMAIADGLVGLIGIPVSILNSIGLPRHYTVCIFLQSIIMVLGTASIFMLVSVSIDRYWAIIHPLSYKVRVTDWVVCGIISFVWIVSIAIGFFPMMGWNKGYYPECFFLEVMDLSYLVFIFGGTILPSAVFLLAVYIRIYLEVRKKVSVL